MYAVMIISNNVPDDILCFTSDREKADEVFLDVARDYNDNEDDLNVALENGYVDISGRTLNLIDFTNYGVCGAKI